MKTEITEATQISNAASIKPITEKMEPKELSNTLNNNFEAVNGRFQILLGNITRFENKFDEFKETTNLKLGHIDDKIGQLDGKIDQILKILKEKNNSTDTSHRHLY